MSIKIKDLPDSERPYEKLELYGEKHLSNAELLAIIIKSGTKEETSVQVAQRILKLKQGFEQDDLSFLKQLTLNELTKIKGIGKVKAIQIKAACEMAVRMSKPINYKGIVIEKPEDVAEMVLTEFKHEKRELSRVFLLDKKNRIIKVADIAIGGINFVEIGFKEIVAEALKVDAQKVVVIHNHPSGDTKPSQKDLEFTDKVYNALAIFEIDLLDHLIIGEMEYTSIYKYIQEEIESKLQKK